MHKTLKLAIGVYNLETLERLPVFDRQMVPLANDQILIRLQ